MVHWHISLISYRFVVIRHLFWLVIAQSDQFQGCFRVKHPQISELHICHPQKRLPYTRPRLLNYSARKVTIPVYVIAPTWRLERSSDPNQIWQNWWTPWHNHPRQISNRLKYNFDFSEGLKFYVLALLRRTPLTRQSPAGLPVNSISMYASAKSS